LSFRVLYLVIPKFSSGYERDGANPTSLFESLNFCRKIKS
jgi:hypothetical protein